MLDELRANTEGKRSSVHPYPRLVGGLRPSVLTYVRLSAEIGEPVEPSGCAGGEDTYGDGRRCVWRHGVSEKKK